MSVTPSPERLAELVRELTGEPETLIEPLTRFLADETHRAGFERLIVGLSGGLDSALAATLAVRALGAEQVLAVLLPCGSHGDVAVRDAGEVAGWLGVRTELIDIEPMVDAHFRRDPDADRVRRGNFMARQRMAVLFDLSMRERALVLGTSNKSEMLLGYGTLHGDLACALNPLGELYKTQVRALARYLGMPAQILDKAPTADLWPGQSDEDELGFSYDTVDPLLYLLVDRGLEPVKAEAYGYEPEFIARVAGTIAASAFKRRLPLIAKIPRRIDAPPDARRTGS